MDSGPHDQLELQAAADQLGVHYQTAYRWVRSGRLAARMVGGRYVVARTAIEEFARSRQIPHSPPPPKTTRLDHAADRMHAALVEGDEPTATKLATRLRDEGAPIVDLMHQVLVPPLHRIGQQWQDGELTISVEHRASAIVERLLGEVAPNPRGRRRGNVAVAALSGDQHSLPTTMATVALRSDNWHVHHLGADLPPDQFVDFCTGNDIDVAVITVTTPSTSQSAITTAEQLVAAGIPTLVGAAGQTLDELIELVRDAAR